MIVLAAGATYEPIATTTISSAVSVVTFSSIPSTYTDLVLVTNATAASARDVVIRINSDTGTNYSYTYLDGTGTAASSGRQTSQTFQSLDNYGYLETGQGQMLLAHFMNYANTTTYKTTISRSANSANGTSAVVGLWRSTSAINRIDIYAGTAMANITSGTFTLYGIAAA